MGNSDLTAQMVGTMVLICLAKVAMIGSLAAYAFIVAYDNVVDYGSNYEFVRHVLSMDTTFPGNAKIHQDKDKNSDHLKKSIGTTVQGLALQMQTEH